MPAQQLQRERTKANIRQKIFLQLYALFFIEIKGDLSILEIWLKTDWKHSPTSSTMMVSVLEKVLHDSLWSCDFFFVFFYSRQTSKCSVCSVQFFCSDIRKYWQPHVLFQEEVKEVTSILSVHGQNVKVTEVLKDGDTLTFLIVSQKVRKRSIYVWFAAAICS